ncbi:MAG: type II toxin-antitoxin system Phd/YefM family antitoxin [Oscillospiraceae bacterium]|jgi:PHD/YefM family antitoxin component YafN of YafNO toxin-antitoxin module|nr:type II toxin-antitoxin system Phd/YefM family antitoxin [Oscillospiraceae bacterium]
MINSLSVSSMLDALVPISRFNKGEANKIFDEVKESGCKIVVKNNVPACVLLTPERYQEMLEMLEDQYLLALAEERVKRGNGRTYSFDDVIKSHGFTKEELEGTEVEID